MGEFWVPAQLMIPPLYDDTDIPGRTGFEWAGAQPWLLESDTYTTWETFGPVGSKTNIYYGPGTYQEGPWQPDQVMSIPGVRPGVIHHADLVVGVRSWFYVNGRLVTGHGTDYTLDDDYIYNNVVWLGNFFSFHTGWTSSIGANTTYYMGASPEGTIMKQRIDQEAIDWLNSPGGDDFWLRGMDHPGWGLSGPMWGPWQGRVHVDFLLALHGHTVDDEHHAKLEIYKVGMMFYTEGKPRGTTRGRASGRVVSFERSRS